MLFEFSNSKKNVLNHFGYKHMELPLQLNVEQF